MRVLHTSDWHLGKRLEQCERTDEHQHFLNWLLQTIEERQVEILLVAGDLFDTGSPSNAALRQYYDFLRALRRTCCREMVVIGGNHDSVATLNAPRTLLRYFNVHVIGGVPDDITEQIIPLKNAAGQVGLVVCAVPFLRDKDVRLSIPGETFQERESRIKQGICDHYARLVPYIQIYKEQQIPVIATGHLFAAGGNASESEKEIHVGNLGQIGADQFPAAFDYIALGHLHRPQLVNGRFHIRYSGSPIPLSFSEATDKKLVLLLDFEAGLLKNLEEISIPPCRDLHRIKGDLPTVKNKLLLLTGGAHTFPGWVEVQLETEQFLPDLEEQLQQLLSNKPFIERIFTRQIRLRQARQLEESVSESFSLRDLSPQEVFIKRCEAVFPEKDYAGLLQTFNEALEQMQQAIN